MAVTNYQLLVPVRLERDERSMTAAPRTYRKSAKRQAGAGERRQAIKAAARAVFAQVGLDGASVSAIVAASGLSTGTFYNYYGTKEAVFNDLLDEMVERTSFLTGAARRQAATLEEMFLTSYGEFLHYLVREDVIPLIERNQHHVRIGIQSRDSGRKLLAEITEDIARAISSDCHLPKTDLTFIAHMVISNGIDAALTLRPQSIGDVPRTAQIMADLTVGGIEKAIRSR